MGDLLGRRQHREGVSRILGGDEAVDTPVEPALPRIRAAILNTTRIPTEICDPVAPRHPAELDAKVQVDGLIRIPPALQDS
ncbi:MAG: hypothetical protein KGQ66_17030 [Acidobacteriota bacterium]|nr:hypothetical protein [Acidobacteriota bacterium]